MTPTADDLVKNLAALSRRFAGLAAKLAQAARELEGAGTLPPDSLLEEFAAARGEFIDLRSSVLDAARTLGVTAPAPAAIDGLKALEPVVRALAEDRKSTRLNSSHGYISYAVFCLKNNSRFHVPRPPRQCVGYTMYLRTWSRGRASCPKGDISTPIAQVVYWQRQSKSRTSE